MNLDVSFNNEMSQLKNDLRLEKNVMKEEEIKIAVP